MMHNHASNVLHKLLPQLGAGLERAYSDTVPIGKSAALTAIPDERIAPLKCSGSIAVCDGVVLDGEICRDTIFD